MQTLQNLIRNFVLKTFVIKVNAIKLSRFRCRLDTIIKIKVEGNGGVDIYENIAEKYTREKTMLMKNKNNKMKRCEQNI